ncbi:MAG: hypothetical protein WB688_23160, partial [Trebonia sp.]
PPAPAPGRTRTRISSPTRRASPPGIGRITVYVPARAAPAAREGARMAEGSVVVILLALVPERAAVVARPADD